MVEINNPVVNKLPGITSYSGRHGRSCCYNDVVRVGSSYNDYSVERALMETMTDEMMADQERRTMPVRLGHKAIEAAKIAGSLRGMSLAEYATTVLLEAANRDIDAYSKARVKAKSGDK
jgi:hypothetical protein